MNSLIDEFYSCIIMCLCILASCVNFLACDEKIFLLLITRNDLITRRLVINYSMYV